MRVWHWAAKEAAYSFKTWLKFVSKCLKLFAQCHFWCTNESALISEIKMKVNRTEMKMTDETEHAVLLVYETYLSPFATLEWWKMGNLIWLSKENPEISLEEKQIASLCQLGGKTVQFEGRTQRIGHKNRNVTQHDNIKPVGRAVRDSCDSSLPLFLHFKTTDSDL